MQYFIEGLGWGLLLAFSMGPIFILLTQTAIEKGYKAGLSVGAGIWVSDFIYIYLCYRFIVSIESTFNNPKIKLWIGGIGGLILIIFGIYLIAKKKVLKQETQELTTKNMVGYFSKGFVVNTINPFTPVFWLTIVSTYVLGKGIDTNASAILFGTIMMVIILSDSAKVFLAEYIRTRLNAKHLHYIAIISGAFLILFGLLMFYRVT